MPRKLKAVEKIPVTPLVVSPKQAQALLGVGRSYLYELLGKGCLDFYKEGTLTRITLDSINRHVAQRLSESGGRKGRCRSATTQIEPTTTQETAAETKGKAAA